MCGGYTWKRTASDIAPRWTGTWGAFATRSPAGLNRAQEKSSRSLMFTLMLVRCSIRPICSAIPMNLSTGQGQQHISTKCCSREGKSSAYHKSCVTRSVDFSWNQGELEDMTCVRRCPAAQGHSDQGPDLCLPPHAGHQCARPLQAHSCQQQRGAEMTRRAPASDFAAGMIANSF